MRFRFLLLSILSGLLCRPLLAQSAPQPFAAPPTLQEKAVPGKAFALTVAAPPHGCNPSGDITHDGNLVTLDLHVIEQLNKIYNPGTSSMDDVQLRSYGGCLTGPLIEVHPGNTLRVYLDNDLDKQAPTAPACPDGGPPCFNIINLHFHGLHVSPAGNSDNVLLNIAPKTKFEYEVNVPPDHPSGTFWYHAHRHGSTSLQVASGASGVLIVRGDRPYTGYAPGDVDTILHDGAGKPFTEQIALFQQIPYACFADANDQKIITNPDGTWLCPAGHTGVVENFGEQLSSPTVWDNSGRFTSINGVVQPAITNVAAGEIQRWRMIHGGIHDTVNVQIVPMVSKGPNAALALRGIFFGTPAQQAKTIAEVCPITIPDSTKPVDLVPQFEIAADGLTRTAIRPIGVGLQSVSGGFGSNFLQPGYRSDVLVVFPHPGTYCVLNQAATPAERANAGPNGGPGGQGPNETQLLATVIVKDGTNVPVDQLMKYVEETLVKNNSNLPQDALKDLANGDLTPWRGMPESGPASNATDPLKVSFYIGNLPSPPTPPTKPPGAFGFYINSKEYDPDRIDFTRQVGATEDWQLTSYGEPHIFHIHVNPFEVMDVTYQGKSIYGDHGECLIPPDSLGLENQY